MNHEERAKSLMQHYFRLVAERTGIRWDFENDSEIEGLVDHLIAAAQPGGRPAQPSPAPAQPDPLTRIAVAVERIADQLTAANVEIADARKRAEEIRRREAEPPF